jgi:hypothetical protein
MVTDARDQTLGISFESMRNQYLEKISLRRMVTMEEVAAMVLFYHHELQPTSAVRPSALMGIFNIYD